MDIAGWENMYRIGERGSEEHPTALLVETAQERSPGTALDLACGTGRNALYLAEIGWQVIAIDGSASAVDEVKKRAASRELNVIAEVADLTSPTLSLPEDAFDLVVIAYYLQRDLYPIAKTAVRPGGLLLAIAHTAEPGETPSPKRVNSGELRSLFDEWEILYEYEGPSRDPAHRRPVSELVARRI
jgi:tellurite methyltransferase